MLLAVDIGNTQTTLGVFDGTRPAGHWRIATDMGSTADELRVTLRQLLSIEGMSESGLTAVCMSSVVPTLTQTWQECADLMGQRCVSVNAATVPWLPMAYENPSEIGADRLADAVGAIEKYGAPVVVVDLGTATNIEVIDRNGAFLGGIIAPGFLTSAAALFKNASRISSVDLDAPENPIGTNTRNAVQSGLLFGEVDRIDGLVRRIYAQLGYRPPVIATGGLAHRIAPYSAEIASVDETLTLEGLRFIYEKQAPAQER